MRPPSIHRAPAERMRVSPIDRILDRVGDFRLRIATYGSAELCLPGQRHYATVSFRATKLIFDHLRPSLEDVIVDIGCGKGRVVCCAAQRHVKQVVGIEYNPELAKIALRNLQRMPNKRAPASIEIGLAEDFDYSSASLIYLYNPFDATALYGCPRADRGLDPAAAATVAIRVHKSAAR